jgi:phospholipid-translocating ATPase
MVVMKGLDTYWYRYLMRFVLLFSYIIPISLRVNLDMAKLFYTWQIGRDKNIPETVVRSSTIPEELGRIAFLLSDKTGTLTRNEMRFKKVIVSLFSLKFISCQIHLGSTSFGGETFSDVRMHVESAYGGKLARNSFSVKLQSAVEAIALCHNVTPIDERGKPTFYQAASPDEVFLNLL